MSKGKKILIILVTAIVSGAFVFGGVYMLKFPPTFSSEASELEKSLKIEDFAYDVKQANLDGEDKYVLSLTNNSQFELVSAGIYYKTKSDATEDQLKVFEEFVKENEGSKLENVILFGSNEAYIGPKQSIDNIVLSLGIASQVTDAGVQPTPEQFALLEPSMLMFAFKGNGNDLYNAYYDLEKKDWDIQKSSAAVNVNQLPENLDSKLMPNLDNHLYYSLEQNNKKQFDVNVFGLTQEEYKAYTDSLKSQGFTKGLNEEALEGGKRESWYAEDDNNTAITMIMDYSRRILEINIVKS